MRSTTSHPIPSMTTSRLRLLLIRLAPVTDPLQYLLPILIQLHLRDLDLARRDTNWYTLAVALLARHALDVHDVLEAVDGGDFALAAFVAAALDDYFVVFPDRDCADL